MENGRKKLRICLICVVLAAVVVGIFYYYYDAGNGEAVNKGTLIVQERAGDIVHGWFK